MILTALWSVWFGIFMVITIPFLILLYLVRFIAGRKAADSYSHAVTRIWGRLTVLTTGSKVKVFGFEKLTDQTNVCFIANHQSFFDIPLILGWLDRQVGFIAKKELKKVPILNEWISSIHSAFIDRSNPRKAIDSIKKGTESIRQGHAIVIFPEGTRGKGNIVNEFKPGSIKLATIANAVIQPITIKGTRKVFETTHRIMKAHITLTIHDPIYPTDPIYNDKTLLIQNLHNTISAD